MSKQNAGHYAAKHPPGTRVSPSIEQAIRDKMTDNKITCRAAHDIAAALGVEPQEVGVGIDLLEARISQCQLGLFGHGQPHEDASSSDTVPPEFRAGIEAAVIDGRLGCADAWRIADARGIPRARITKFCNAMKVKISKCQIGAF